MKKTGYFLLGLFTSGVIPIIGFGITKLAEHGGPVVISLISIIPIGLHIYYKHNKSIGLGVLIGIIPLALLTFLFIMVSNLH